MPSLIPNDRRDKMLIIKKRGKLHRSSIINGLPLAGVL